MPHVLREQIKRALNRGINVNIPNPNIPIPKFVETAARAISRSRLFQTIGWNIPVLLAVLGFFVGFEELRRLPIYESMGFRWAVVNSKTIRAEAILNWSAEHLWVVLLSAVLYNVLYLLRPATQTQRLVRVTMLIACSGFFMWYFEQCFHLARKVFITP